MFDPMRRRPYAGGTRTAHHAPLTRTATGGADRDEGRATGPGGKDQTVTDTRGSDDGLASVHELPDGVIVLNDAYNANPDSMRAGLDALAAIGADASVARTIAVLGEMRELGPDSEREHVAVGRYAAERGIDLVVVVGDDARGIAEGAGSAVLLPDNAAATAWVQEHVGAGDAVLVKASNGARLYEVAEALL